MGVARVLRGSAIGITGAGLVGVLCGASSVAAAGPPRIIPSCRGLSRSSVVYRAGRVVVYRAAVRGDGGPHDWACWSGSRSPMASPAGLGTAPGGGFAAGAVVSDFVSDGPWLVDLASSKRGWSSCPPGSSTRHCRRDHHEVELTDVIGDGQTSTPSAGRVQLHLSALPAHGGDRIAAVVWTQRAPGSRITLRAMTARDTRNSGAFGLNPPVTGKINPRSVRLHGLRVSFIENGRRRSITLGT